MNSRFSAFTAWHGTARQHSTFLVVVGETLGLGALSSPDCWAHMNRDHTALEVSSLSLLLILHCTGKPHFIVLCRFCFFFFFFLQTEGLWQCCVKHAYQCHVPNSIVFKLRSVHLKEKLMLLNRLQYKGNFYMH